MSSRIITIESGETSVAFNFETAGFRIRSGPFMIEGLQAGFEAENGSPLKGSALSWRARNVSRHAFVAVGSHAAFSMEISFSLERQNIRGEKLDSIIISPSISSERPFSMERIYYMDSTTHFKAPPWLFTNGRGMGSEGTIKTANGGRFSSWGIHGWSCGDEVLFFSFPMRQPLPSNFEGGFDDGIMKEFKVKCNVELDQITETIEAPPLTISFSRKPHDYLEDYADKQWPNGRSHIKKPVHGWNSWDYAYCVPSEDYVMKNVDFIANDPVLGKKIEYIVVDAGWQHRCGDWEANYRFPSGMDNLARKIMERGFKPGLWFSPCAIEDESFTGYYHSDMMACGLSGRVCGTDNRCFALDITKEKSKKFLRELFSRYRNMGYSYFKLDYLRYIVKAHLFSGERVPKGNLIRQVIDTIREVAPDCHILGCNFLHENGVGLVDSNRVTPDAGPYWYRIPENLRALSSRWWMHNRLWCSDPDFAVCRSEETSDDPDLYKYRYQCANIYIPPDQKEKVKPWRHLSIDESRLYLTHIVLSGGDIFLGDNLPGLNRKGLDLLRRTISAEHGNAARPLDIFRTEQASLFVQELPSSAMRLAVVNWSDSNISTDIDIELITGRKWTHVVDFWTDQRFDGSSGRIPANIPPHGVSFLALSS